MSSLPPKEILPPTPCPQEVKSFNLKVPTAESAYPVMSICAATVLAVDETCNLLVGPLVPMPTLPVEAIVSSSVAELLSIDNLSLAPASVLFDCMKNLFSELLAEIISREAVAALLYISNLGEMDAELAKATNPSKAALPSTSISPEMRSSLEAVIDPAWVVVAVPKRE